MNGNKTITAVAGVDVSKRRLDAALAAGEDRLQVANTEVGLAELVGWLREHGVQRVGLEATGGYEREAIAAFAAAGLAVVVHQPLEVRLFARLKRLKAKNDRLDARLIALATAQSDAVKAAADPRLTELAERLTAYEQAADLVAQLRTQLEHLRLPDLLEDARALLARKRRLALGRIKAEEDLARRFRLLQSLPGVGPVVAAALVVRMPELGSMRRGQAAALLGVAPFDRDSGALRGQRHIGGGRQRPRRLLYLSAMTAARSDPSLRTFAQRLLAAGNPTSSSPPPSCASSSKPQTSSSPEANPGST